MKRITRKEFLKRSVWSGASSLLLARLGEARGVRPSGPPLDLVIVNGRVIDGTGKPAFSAAVGIRGGRIADIGAIPPTAAARTIDAAGQVVCPGFIDPHAHEEILLLRDPMLEKFVRQGVTTIVNGNCGHSVTPYKASKVLEYWWREALISKEASRMPVDWEGVDGYAKLVASRGGTGVNSAVLLGYGGLRWGAMKGAHDRPPTDTEWREIERLVKTGLQQGAVGLSTGLSYIPCSYATTEELVRVAKILAAQNKTYASHTRFGKPGDPTGGLEAIEIGEKSGCRVQISHFVGRFKGALDMVSAASERGVRVTADVIPQSLSHRRRSDRMVEAMMVFYPGVFDKSEDELRAMLADPVKRKDIVKRTNFFNNDKTRVVIARAETVKYRPHVGRSIADLAREAGKDPNDLYVEMVLDRNDTVIFTFDGDTRQLTGQSDQALAQQYGSENLLPEGQWTTHPLFGPGSDSIPVDKQDPYGWYEQQRRGAFPGYFRHARASGVPLETAVMKAAALPARQFQLMNRGTLERGKAADLIVFNPETYAFPSPAEVDPNEPGGFASGVSSVVVNGIPVLLDGVLTGQRPGRVLI